MELQLFEGIWYIKVPGGPNPATIRAGTYFPMPDNNPKSSLLLTLVDACSEHDNPDLKHLHEALIKHKNLPGADKLHRGMFISGCLVPLLADYFVKELKADIPDIESFKASMMSDVAGLKMSGMI